MLNIGIKDIVTLNLKYGSSAKPLKVLAFAQLANKALFFAGKPLTIAELAKNIADIIGVRNVSEDLVRNGLDYLKDINKVNPHFDTWLLPENAKEEINQEIEASRNLIDGVLKRHFPTTIDRHILRDWFKQSASDFFGCQGDEWIIALSKQAKPTTRNKPIEYILDPSIKKSGLTGESKVLIEGFIGFLSSEDNSDLQCLMMFSQAMFSARLVAADIGVDLYTLEELKNAKILIDTNIFFSIVLESNRLSKSINSLGEELKAIKSELFCLYTTKEEYKRVVAGKKNEIKPLIDKYSDEVIKDVGDNFIATARDRGCRSSEDYERFFTSIAEAPKALPNGYEIFLEDGKDVELVSQKAIGDVALKKQIEECSLKIRPKWKRPKSEAAICHDASLLKVADFINTQGQKCFILTLDRSLQACAIQRSGPHGIPTALSVSAFIEILAMNNGGPSLDSSNFAPLLAKIILNECIPPVNTYTIQDLQLLNSINEEAAKLPSEKVRQMVKKISKARMEGRAIGNTSLQLEINRMFQDEKMATGKELHETLQAKKQSDDEAKSEKNLRKKREEELVTLKTNDIKRKARNTLIAMGLVWFGLAVFIFFVLFHGYQVVIDANNKANTIRYLISFVGPIISLIITMRGEFAKYAEKIKNAQNTAIGEVKSKSCNSER